MVASETSTWAAYTMDDDGFPVFAVPPSPNKKFLARARHEIKKAIHLVPLSEYSQSHENIVVRTREAIMAQLYMRHDSMLRNPHRWDDSARAINAVRAGIVTGDVSFHRLSDLRAFVHAVINTGSICDIIEHYVRTGELMDLLKEVHEEYLRFIGNKEHPLDVPTTKFLRIFFYDMTEGHEGIPLDIRLEFSGFYEDAQEPQRDIDGDIISSTDDLRAAVAVAAALPAKRARELEDAAW